MKKSIFKIMLIIFSILLLISLSVFAFLQHPKFGKMPTGKRLQKIEASPNYQNGSFQNLNPTPVMTEGISYLDVMKEFVFAKNKVPSQVLPSMKTDLKQIAQNQDVLVWFGHSSYFIQLNGKRILVDPVFSGSASPIAFTTKAFEGTDRYTADDMPEIDYLFITHDHWDHLDYQTVMELKPKVKTIITGLGTAAHLEYWGFDSKNIIEKDWNESVELEEGYFIHSIPARHFSGRGFTRNKSLWTSFIFQSPDFKVFIGGDSGYDSHFKIAGDTFGPIDLAILENGQNDKSWKYIHMMPEEVLQAAKDLQAKRLLPVHSSKFALANHSWDAPLKNITEANTSGFPMITPMIGEQVNLRDTMQVFSKWWEGIQ